MKLYIRRKLILGACVLTLYAAPSSSSFSKGDGPIVIGAVIAESGFMSQYDIPAWNAAKFAIQVSTTVSSRSCTPTPRDCWVGKSSSWFGTIGPTAS